MPPGINSLDVVVQGGGGSAEIATFTTPATNSGFGSFIATGSNAGVGERLELSAVSEAQGSAIQITVGEAATGTDAAGNTVVGLPGVVIVSWKSAMSEQTTGVMTASEDLFLPGHVGSLWRIRQNVPAAEVRHPDSSPLNCYSEWFLETSGYWAGTLYVERYDEDNDRWEIIRTLTSSKDKNYSISGDVQELTKIRLRSENYVAAVPEGTKADAYLLGKAVLQTRATTYDGVVRVAEYINANTAWVEIQRAIAVPGAWTTLWREGAWSDVQGYPGCCGFYQDRLCAGGTKNDPFMFFASQPGDYTNFGVSLPAEDGDCILARILARQNGRIREIVPSGDLLILTDVGEFKMAPSDNGALTPKNVDVKPQSNRGCAIVDPVLVGNQLVFTQAGASIVRDFGYTLDVDGYAGNDLTVLASHFFLDRQLVDMDYQGSPCSVIWCVRDDGTLLGLTYMKEQEVFAWHRHVTQGSFEAVGVLPSEDGQDDVYFIIERLGKRYIERMAEGLPDGELDRAFFVDCGLFYDGTPSKIIYGLDHLAGRPVAILADGAVVEPQAVKKLTVNNASVWGIELKHPAGRVAVGLPYVSTLQTMPVEVSETGALQGKKKYIPNVILRVYDTVGGSVGVDGQEMTPVKWNRMDAPLAAKPSLFTGDCTVKPFSGYKDDGCIKVEQDKPLPFTLLGIVPTIEVK